MEIREIFKKNIIKVLIVIICVNSCGSLWIITKDIIAYLCNDKVTSVIQHIVRESMKDSLEMIRTEYSLNLILRETKNIRTPELIDSTVDGWKYKQWNAQLSALDIVKTSKIAKKFLKKGMYSEQCYKALMNN